MSFRMHDQASAPRGGVVVASGYGLKVYVERGYLVVHDGIADDRRTRRFARISSGLKRLVVLGQAGYVTLDALRWLRDLDAAFGPDRLGRPTRVFDREYRDRPAGATTGSGARVGVGCRC